MGTLTEGFSPSDLSKNSDNIDSINVERFTNPRTASILLIVFCSSVIDRLDVLIRLVAQIILIYTSSGTGIVNRYTMKTRPQRQEQIIEFLSTNRNGTFQEIFRGRKMGRGALAMGIKELLEEDVIKKDGTTYTIQNKPKRNKILREVDRQNMMSYDLEECMESLKKEKMPFEIGYTLLRTAMFSLPKLILDLHSTRLTKSEKNELEKVIEHYNKTIKRTFEVLEEIDFSQTMVLRQGLDNAMTDPQFELKMAGLAKKKHKRKAKKI